MSDLKSVKDRPASEDFVYPKDSFERAEQALDRFVEIAEERFEICPFLLLGFMPEPPKTADIRALVTPGVILGQVLNQYAKHERRILIQKYEKILARYKEFSESLDD